MATSLLRQHFRNKLLSISVPQGNAAFFSCVVAKDLNVTKNVPSLGDDNGNKIVEYPQIKARYPPGQWGEIEPYYAWLWQNTVDELINIPDVKGRQELITSKEMSYLNALPIHKHPDYLQFAKYATKSVFLPWSELPLPPWSQSQDQEGNISKMQINNINTDLIRRAKNAIENQLLIEQEAVKREMSVHPDVSTKILPHFSQKQAGLVTRCIFDTLITHLSGHANHLRTCQYDENVIVRALWDRYGIKRKRKHRLSHQNHFKMEKVLDHRLMSSCIFNGMIRSHLPLPEFQPRDGGLSTNSEMPSLEYKCTSYGVVKKGANKLKSILAGHVLGDPCEYGIVGCLLTNKLRDLDDQFGPKIAQECRLGHGLTATFTWLAAQAYNQGFSGFIDLTYPLTSQTILTDGQNFSFLACQLNTLELWKPDSGNKMVNLCWYTEEKPLYDCIENGQVKGFNEDVLQLLMQMFLLEPVDRGYDMKPTISEKDVDLHKKQNFIPERVIEVIEKKEEQFIV